SEARRIVRGNPMQTSGEQLRKEISAHESDREAGQNESQPLTSDKSQDIARLRAESHAHSDFLRALPDRISHHAINPERGEEKRQPGKDREKRAKESAAPVRLRDHLIH